MLTLERHSVKLFDRLKMSAGDKKKTKEMI